MKKLLAGVMMTAFTALAYENCTVDGISWNYSVSNGKATIELSDLPNVESIIIPDALGGYPVSAIGEWVFDGCSSLVSVKVPDGVEKIGAHAFASCTSLSEFVIGGNVISIGEGAFDGCTSLKSVEIPDSVKTIGYMAFCGCTALESVSIGKGLDSIADRMFDGCLSLLQVSITENVKSIGEGAFAGCERLVSVKNAGGVTVIGREAFDECHSLSDFTIGRNVESIGVGAFWGCEALMSITIPGSASSVGSLAFYECVSLETIAFLGGAPDGLKGSRIFDSATKVYYPEAYADSYKAIVPEEKFAGYVTADIPEIADESQIFAALLGSADSRLAANIKSVAEYARYRDWASGLIGVSREEVKKSPNAWLSYALAAPKLITSTPKDGDISIQSFTRAEAEGVFNFTVDIKDIAIGNGAEEANIRKVIEVEGASDLSPGSFSADSVCVNSANASDGKIKFEVRPQNGSEKSFFFKVKFPCH